MRKLWDARRAANRKVTDLEKADRAAATTIQTLKDNGFRQTKTLEALRADLKALQTLSQDIERLAGSARQIQNDVERLADDVNRANLERASLANRVGANEEWVASINGFRKQVNANVDQLRTDIRRLSASVAEVEQTEPYKVRTIGLECGVVMGAGSSSDALILRT